MQDKKYSIIIPVYKSRDYISNTVNSVVEVLKSNNVFFEIILVNDGSYDGTWNVIKSLAQESEYVTSINLLKNYGQHSAVMCGFSYASGDFIITMDDDLQHPPEEILKLIDGVSSGHDLIFGALEEKMHSRYRRLGSLFVSYLNSMVFNKPKELELSSFRIAHKDVIKRVLSHRTTHPYVPGLLLMYSSHPGNAIVKHNKRDFGQSKYTLKKLLSLVSNLLFNYSSLPYKFLGTLGILISFTSFLLGFLVILKNLFLGVTVQGWTTLVVLTSILGGFIILFLVLIGEYLSRILSLVGISQSYIVQEVVNDNS